MSTAQATEPTLGGITVNAQLLADAHAELERIQREIEKADNYDADGLRRYFTGKASGSLSTAAQVLLTALCQLQPLNLERSVEAVDRILGRYAEPHTDDLRGERDR